MRNTFDNAEKYRVNIPGMPPTKKGDTYGLFIIARETSQVRIIAVDGKETGWEHVSVSMKVQTPGGEKDITPPWDLMQLVKEMFWEDEECVLQFHPPKSQYVNRVSNVLHMWKQVGINHLTPPTILV